MVDASSVAAKLASIKSRMALPVIAAPMFLVSGPDLVIAACKAGVIGSFPTLNARPSEVLEQWFQRIVRELDEFKASGGRPAPWAANLIVHRSNPRAADDLAMTMKYKPEIVITALGTPANVIEGVHAYGGLVFADVNSVAYAKKSVAAGVDGLVLVAAGAGGHTGPITAFSFVPAVREFFLAPLSWAAASSMVRACAPPKCWGPHLPTWARVSSLPKKASLPKAINKCWLRRPRKTLSARRISPACPRTTSSPASSRLALIRRSSALGLIKSSIAAALQTKKPKHGVIYGRPVKVWGR